MIDVIPFPRHVESAAGSFRFRAGTPVRYGDDRLAALAEHFCCDVTHRTGLRPELCPDGRNVLAGHAPFVGIELAPDVGVIAVPAAAGASPSADARPDERYSLTITDDRVIVRATEPVGAARALTTLAHIVAAMPPDIDGAVTLPGMCVLDGPRLACRGVSVDAASRSLTSRHLQPFVDLLALYKLNVLRLQLSDAGTGQIEISRALQDLTGYATTRFVAVQLDGDTGGDAGALQQIHLESHVDVAWLPCLRAVAERTWCEQAPQAVPPETLARRSHGVRAALLRENAAHPEEATT